MIYDLPNPFMRLSVACDVATDREAAAFEPDEPAHGGGGAAAEPVGYPCCVDCGAREPCDEHCPNFVEDRFELDASAFLSEIEPVPAFLTQPVATDSRAIEIEQLLDLARAEEWPAPPVLRQANG